MSVYNDVDFLEGSWSGQADSIVRNTFYFEFIGNRGFDRQDKIGKIMRY